MNTRTYYKVIGPVVFVLCLPEGSNVGENAIEYVDLSLAYLKGTREPKYVKFGIIRFVLNQGTKI
jgi:hypothetical protein